MASTITDSTFPRLLEPSEHAESFLLLSQHCSQIRGTLKESELWCWVCVCGGVKGGDSSNFMTTR